MTFDGTNYSAESAENTPAQVTVPDVGKASAAMADHLYEELRKRDLIAYDSSIPLEVIREITGIAEPTLDGKNAKQARAAFQADALQLLTLRDKIFEKFLMDKGMAFKQRGETWRIPAADEMQAVWRQYASKAAKSIRRAKHLMRNAPSTTVEDSVFAQQQAARISRQLISLQETAVKLF
jgi:hypothetical protein